MQRLDEGTVTIRDAQDGNQVSADTLATVVTGLQRAVLLLAAQEHGLHVSKRFRPSRDLREHYTLRLGVPTEGSYAQPVEVADVRDAATLEDSQGFLPLQAATYVLQTIAQQDLAALEEAVPHFRMRKLLLGIASGFLPSGDWTLKLSSGQLCAEVDAMSRATTLEWLALDNPNVDVDVIGELIAIKFESKTITIKYPPTGKHLEATYDLELEETLFSERRGMVQVSGTATLDDEASPIELTEVNAIRPVDLSPIAVTSVDRGDLHLRAREPLYITPTLSSDDSQLFEATYDHLGIDAFASTREKLVAAIQDEIAFLWECYANEDPSRLASDAQVLRQHLTSAFEVL